MIKFSLLPSHNTCPLRKIWTWKRLCISQWGYLLILILWYCSPAFSDYSLYLVNTHEWELTGGCRFYLWVRFFQILICHASLQVTFNDSLNCISCLLTSPPPPHLIRMVYLLPQQPRVSSLVWRTKHFVHISLSFIVSSILQWVLKTMIFFCSLFSFVLLFLGWE